MTPWGERHNILFLKGGKEAGIGEVIHPKHPAGT